jgi:hypothetical protein
VCGNLERGIFKKAIAPQFLGGSAASDHEHEAAEEFVYLKRSSDDENPLKLFIAYNTDTLGDLKGKIQIAGIDMTGFVLIVKGKKCSDDFRRIAEVASIGEVIGLRPRMKGGAPKKVRKSIQKTNRMVEAQEQSRDAVLKLSKDQSFDMSIATVVADLRTADMLTGEWLKKYDAMVANTSLIDMFIGLPDINLHKVEKVMESGGNTDWKITQLVPLISKDYEKLWDHAAIVSGVREAMCSVFSLLFTKAYYSEASRTYDMKRFRNEISVARATKLMMGGISQ